MSAVQTHYRKDQGLQFSLSILDAVEAEFCVLEKKVPEDKPLTEVPLKFESQADKELFECLSSCVHKRITQSNNEMHNYAGSKIFTHPGRYTCFLSGSHLPVNHLKKGVKNSMFTLDVIRGTPFMLEDGQSCLAHEEALEWAMVNRFSPLQTGNRINP